MRITNHLEHHTLRSFFSAYSLPVFIALGVLILDQISKNLILTNLHAGQSIPLIEGVFHLTFLQNTGIAFSLFQHSNTFFLILSACIILGLIYALIQTPSTEKLTQSLLGVIIGGALGNLTDRLFLGYVVDFIDFRIWPVFNIADSGVTLGVIGLILILWKK
jgi:signal peptidase II